MTRRMFVLDLFAGLRGWSDPFAERGHSVFTVEYDYSFPGIDLYRDIARLTLPELQEALTAKWGHASPDVILASPPCTAFTTMTMGRNWTMDGEPRTQTAVMGKALVLATMDIIAALAPRWWVVENPRARLRTLPFAPDTWWDFGARRETVWYCRYGEDRAKPTDLWGGFPGSWIPRAGCHNGNPDHIAAPRGSRGGTQGGVAGDIAAMIPRELSIEICEAIESELR